jgi:hypothetical protein
MFSRTIGFVAPTLVVAATVNVWAAVVAGSGAAAKLRLVGVAIADKSTMNAAASGERGVVVL